MNNDERSELAMRLATLERELAEARVRQAELVVQLDAAGRVAAREMARAEAAEARLAAVAPLLKACASVREISERGDALMSELRTCLTEQVLREILGCAALSAPAEPKPALALAHVGMDREEWMASGTPAEPKRAKRPPPKGAVNCIGLDYVAPTEPQCTHEGIGLPGCSTCDPRTKSEGGPREPAESKEETWTCPTCNDPECG